MKPFRQFLIEHDKSTVTNDPRYKTLDADSKGAVDRWLNMFDVRHDPRAIDMALQTLNRFAPQVDVEYEKFLKLWKARPVLGAGGSGPMEDRLAAHNKALAAYYRKHFGGLNVWPDVLMRRYTAAFFTDDPAITYKGTRYPLKTGLDEKDFVWDVIKDNRVKLK